MPPHHSEAARELHMGWIFLSHVILNINLSLLFLKNIGNPRGMAYAQVICIITLEHNSDTNNLPCINIEVTLGLKLPTLNMAHGDRKTNVAQNRYESWKA